MFQCALRSIEPGPINTYPGWKALNRNLKRGEKAIWLCLPVTRKITGEQTGESAVVVTNFVWKRRWFVLSQTEDELIETITTPAWDEEQALTALRIPETPFTNTDGNVQGYAKGRKISISPIAAMPHKTLLHELAHIELGHTAESAFADSEETSRSLREAEAEAVAMPLCESLELHGVEYSEGLYSGLAQGRCDSRKVRTKDIRSG